jgi:hypothetical protein
MIKQLDKKKFVEGIGHLCSSFTNSPEFTPKMINEWYRILKDELSADEFNESVKSTVLNLKFFPSIYELIEHSGRRPELQV